MKITYEQTFPVPLTDFGSELAGMIKDCRYGEIADRFGYVRAFDRPSANAISSDILHCLSADGRHAAIRVISEPRISVKYFEQPNNLHLFGLVECFLALEQDDGELLAELVVSEKGREFHLLLEDVSYMA